MSAWMRYPENKPPNRSLCVVDKKVGISSDYVFAFYGDLGGFDDPDEGFIEDQLVQRFIVIEEHQE